VLSFFNALLAKHHLSIFRRDLKGRVWRGERRKGKRKGKNAGQRGVQSDRALAEKNLSCILEVPPAGHKLQGEGVFQKEAVGSQTRKLKRKK